MSFVQLNPYYSHQPKLMLIYFLKGTKEIKKKIANDFSNGLHKHGIVKLINHKIPLTLISQFHAGMSGFFDESIEHKMKYKKSLNGYQRRGFIAKGEEKVFYNNKSLGVDI
eukprot:538394_1